MRSGKASIIEHIIELAGPILAARGSYLITMNGGSDLLVWKVDDESFTVEMSIAGEAGGRFKYDIGCLASNASYKLEEYLKHSKTETFE